MVNIERIHGLSRRLFLFCSAGIAAAVTVCSRPLQAQPLADSARVSARLYARAGEVVTCEEGYPVARFTRDVYYGEVFDPAALSFIAAVSPDKWRPPQIGDRDVRCPCGARFWRPSNNFHFEHGGWR